MMDYFSMNGKGEIKMKRTISLIIALVLCIGLCACSNENTDIKTAVVGTWECTFESGGEMWTDIITIYKGGTGRFQELKDGKPGSGNSSTTWEIKDGVLNITVLAWNGVYAYTYDSESDTLTQVDGSRVFTRSKS